MRIPLPLAGEKLAPDYGPNWHPSGVMWATGFRPFFLGAGVVGALLVPFWIAILNGAADAPRHFGPIAWHAHEMLFGYAVAVVAGFLLTATARWTNRPTATGGHLMALFLLWFAGRLVMLAPMGLSPQTVALIDVAFLPALALTLSRPIWLARDERNYGFPVLLIVMAVANGVLHLRAAEGLPLPRWGLRVGIDVVALFMIVVGGRIIPQFTANRLRMETTRSPEWAKWQLRAAVAVLVLDFAGARETLVALIALLAAFATFRRMAGWQTAPTLKVPMLWILHAGWAWVGVAFLLRGLDPFLDPVTASAWVHAMTAGAIGSLTLGMMTRVSLGHTGRVIAAPRGITPAFGAVVGSAVLRGFGPIVAPGMTAAWLWWASALWAAAFLTFLLVYLPILRSPRVDGKAG